MMYWDIFFCFLKIGAFSFGGGYAALPLIQGEVVGNYGWLSMREFTDLVTISQMTPAPSRSTRPPSWARAWQVCPEPSSLPQAACSRPASSSHWWLKCT